MRIHIKQSLVTLTGTKEYVLMVSGAIFLTRFDQPSAMHHPSIPFFQGIDRL